VTILILKLLFGLFNLTVDIAVLCFIIWLGYGLIRHTIKEWREND